MGRKLRELTIKDDFMFGAVMSDPENCRELLEMILGISIDRIEVSKEKSMVYHPEYKGVRLDVYARDGEYLLQCRNAGITKNRYLEKEAVIIKDQWTWRCCKAAETMKNCQKVLWCLFVILIPFGKELYRYTFKMKCEEDVNVELEDARRIIFLSTQGKNREEVPKELVTFGICESGFRRKSERFS